MENYEKDVESDIDTKTKLVQSGKSSQISGTQCCNEFTSSSDDNSDIDIPECSTPTLLDPPKIGTFIENQRLSIDMDENIGQVASSISIQDAKRAYKKQLFSIGRRTGQNVREGKNIKETDGKEHFDDYFTESSSFSSTLENVSDATISSLDYSHPSCKSFDKICSDHQKPSEIPQNLHTEDFISSAAGNKGCEGNKEKKK